MENIIELQDLIFVYGQEEGTIISKRAVDNVTLSIKKGSFSAIIGRNGSGKSTLAKNINALLLPSSGRVYVKGMDTRDEALIWDIRQSAGMVFQNPDNQLVSSIVEDDVAFGPENLGIDPIEIRQRVDEALAAVDMLDAKKKGPHLLSGGQKQRIAIAGVVAMRPDCIIFDESTAMLDPKGRQEVLRIIKKLNQEGITVVLITHFMDEAAKADYIFVMDQGKVVMEGNPKDIFVRAKELRQLSLDVPLVVEISESLRSRGINIPENIITIEEMVDFICQSN
ncbi:MAG: energy-coupling factor transporter ATPase [Anaerovoracaceae bacterium]|nr:energy-coupling factor transporter ATPase [Anaerovoracaceae bacterium]